MQSSNWRERHAALICLAQIAEGCTKTMLKSLGDLTRLCMAVRTVLCLYAVLNLPRLVLLRRAPG